MTISAVFKSPMPSFTYIYKNGMTAVFISGRYTTDNEALVKELFEEVGEVGKTKSRHPYIYVDEDEQEIDSEALSPIELIKLQAKEEARAELLAEQKEATARAMNPASNVSSTESASFASSVGTSANIAEMLGGTQAAPVTDSAASLTPTIAGNAKLAALAASIKKD